MFYVVSEYLPTVALFVDVSRAYAFRNQLEDLQIQAEVVWTMREVEKDGRKSSGHYC